MRLFNITQLEAHTLRLADDEVWFFAFAEKGSLKRRKVVLLTEHICPSCGTHVLNFDDFIDMDSMAFCLHARMRAIIERVYSPLECRRLYPFLYGIKSVKEFKDVRK